MISYTRLVAPASVLLLAAACGSQDPGDSPAAVTPANPTGPVGLVPTTTQQQPGGGGAPAGQSPSAPVTSSSPASVPVNGGPSFAPGGGGVPQEPAGEPAPTDVPEMMAATGASSEPTPAPESTTTSESPVPPESTATPEPTAPPEVEPVPVPAGEMPRPASKIPNKEWPQDQQGKGISPTMDEVHHNQPSILNGYLMLAGNAEHSFWDISDPKKPKKLADVKSEHNNGEAESHEVAFAKYPGAYYSATVSGKGFDIWNVTDMTSPKHVSHVNIPGINYGDVAGGVWGLAWQGNYIYVGANDTGLHIVNAKDPSAAKVVKTLPNSKTGGFFPGPVFAMGNILIVTSPKDKGGVATLEISNPTDPVLLDSIVTKKSYIGWYYGGHVFLQTPLRSYDVLSDPANIAVAMDGMSTAPSEYMSFGDDQMFLGLLRPHPGVIRYDVSNLAKPKKLEKIEGRYMYEGKRQLENDDQFSLKAGNLLVLSDDQKTTGNKYAGSFIVVENAKPDSIPPKVKNVWPRDGMAVGTLSSVGVSFSDQIELATVGAPSFVVREVGGAPVAGKWGHMRTLLNFSPDEPLKAGSSYEIILPKGGITDLGGNAIAEEYRSTFTVQ